MASERVEHGAGQRYQHDIAHFRRGIGQHARKHHGDGNGMPVGTQHDGAHGGRQKAGFLSDADAQHRHQHHAQRRKAGEIGGEAGENAPEAILVHQADRADHAVGGASAGAFGARVFHGDFQKPAKQARCQDHQPGQDRKQGDRVGQEIAQPLHTIKKAGHYTALVGARRRARLCHGANSSAVRGSAYHARRGCPGPVLQMPQLRQRSVAG